MCKATDPLHNVRKKLLSHITIFTSSSKCITARNKNNSSRIIRSCNTTILFRNNTVSLGKKTITLRHKKSMWKVIDPLHKVRKYLPPRITIITSRSKCIMLRKNTTTICNLLF